MKRRVAKDSKDSVEKDEAFYATSNFPIFFGSHLYAKRDCASQIGL